MTDATEQFLQMASETIDKVFGRRFDIWLPGDAWHTFGSVPCEYHMQASPSLLQLLERALQDDAEPFVEMILGRCLLVIPLREHRRVIAVATTSFVDESSSLLLRMARVSLEQLELQRELQRTRKQTQAFAAETTQTYEELFLLRCLAEHLETSDLLQPPLKQFESVLPLVKDTILAESVLLIGPSGEGPHATDPMKVTRELICCAGPQPPSHVWNAVLDVYGREACSKSYVNNQSASISAAVNSSLVRQLILVPVMANCQWLGWIMVLNRQRSQAKNGVDAWLQFAEPEFGTVEAGLVSTAASILGTHVRNHTLFRENEQMLTSAVRCLVSAIDAKDPYTSGHSGRVGLFAESLGRQLGLDEKRCSELHLMGLLHDVGKIAIKGSTLRKPGRLTDDEFAEIKEHPKRGWEILYDLDKHGNLLLGVAHHHEHYDGNGYPDGLAGEEIPLSGRILAVADTYDAVTSDRPYREGMSQEKAEMILRDGAGSQWDPAVIEAASRIMPQWIRIRESYQSAPTANRQPLKSAPPSPAPAHSPTPQLDSVASTTGAIAGA